MPLLAARKFTARCVAEHATFAASVRGGPGAALVLLHRLMFLYFLQQRGFLGGAIDGIRRRLFQRENGPFVVPDAEMAVADAACNRLFAFFDEYEWRLDDSGLTAEEIVTPAVIGPLFEKHVNRKEQGAYYTKDDVTAYLASRTVLPAVLDAAARRCPAVFAPDGLAWHLLRADPGRYILAAVQEPAMLPGESEVERRGRRRRGEELYALLRGGAVGAVNELVTLNLDLPRFAADVLAAGDAELRRTVLESLTTLRILDPTCGSGAFLVAALKVLDALLHFCSPRRRFLLLCDIVRRNLFGVDLMPEAVELCRMRLLLELAARADTAADLDDMAGLVANIRTGNVLTDQVAAGDGRGFDVVLGNPPYLPAERVRQTYSVAGYQTARCPDVYAWVLERSAALLRPGGRCGMIVPLSLGFSGAFAACRRLLFETYGENWFASFGRIPAALFAGDVRVRNVLHLGHKVKPPGRSHTTRLHRWFEAARPHLLDTLAYVPFDPTCWRQRVPKLNAPVLADALEDCLRRSAARLGGNLVRQPTPFVLHFKKTAYNWLTFCRELPPCFNAHGQPSTPTQYDTLYFADAQQRDLALLLLNGKWVFAFWCIVGDDFHVTRGTIADFPLDRGRVPQEAVARLLPLVPELERAMHGAIAFKRNAGQRVGTCNLARCRHVTDRSDRIFAEVLGLAPVWDELELLMAQVVKTEFAPR